MLSLNNGGPIPPPPTLAAMKVALDTAYGSPDVIRIAEVPTPLVKQIKALLRIHAQAVNAHAINRFTGLCSQENRAIQPACVQLRGIPCAQVHPRRSIPSKFAQGA
jgi:hypothetical protein